MQEIVEKAAHYFKQGDFHTARELYQKVAACYGEPFVAANLFFCDQAIKASCKMTSAVDEEGATGYRNWDVINASTQQISSQLHDTQILLEKYFILAQSQK